MSLEQSCKLLTINHLDPRVGCSPLPLGDGVVTPVHEKELPREKRRVLADLVKQFITHLYCNTSSGMASSHACCNMLRTEVASIEFGSGVQHERPNGLSNRVFPINVHQHRPTFSSVPSLSSTKTLSEASGCLAARAFSTSPLGLPLTVWLKIRSFE